MEISELIKKVRKIEIRIRRLSKQLFVGGYHSAFKGRGMSFSEVRQYQFGDDVRAIDWNVTARTGEAYIKIFEEEREQTLLLLADLSGSTFFGAQGPDKRELIAEICAVLAFSAEANNDKVGLLLFADKPLLYIPPKKGRQHVLRIVRELLQTEGEGLGTDLAGALRFARNVLKQRSVCVLLSDFQAADYEKSIAVMARRHELIGIHCWDALERDLPDLGPIRWRDAESGAEHWIDSSDPAQRRRYREIFDQRQARTAQNFRKSGADLVSIRSDQPYAPHLLQLFERRSSHAI